MSGFEPNGKRVKLDLSTDPPSAPARPPRPGTPFSRAPTPFNERHFLPIIEEVNEEEDGNLVDRPNPVLAPVVVDDYEDLDQEDKEISDAFGGARSIINFCMSANFKCELICAPEFPF